MNVQEDGTAMTFWEHLEVLRGVLWRSLLAVLCGSVVLFVAKGWLFRWILAPCSSDFLTYRWLSAAAGGFGTADGAGAFDAFTLRLISTELSAQFQIHLTTAFEGGILLASPYVLYQLFGFIAPALYDRERRLAYVVLPVAYLLFLVGIVVNYYILFPVALHFLASYRVSDAVANVITLSSYMSTFSSMTLTVGLIFELPVVLWLLGKMGFVTSGVLRRYRRHALVGIMILAATVTPPDICTMLLVTVPLYMLYEASIHVVPK
jgi:sec-independent protein translocase protein TatC